MNMKKSVLFSALLAVACQAPPAQANVAMAVNITTLTVISLNTAIQKWGAPKQPRGMVVCADSWSQDVCRAGLGNGDFEDPNNPEALDGWLLEAGAFSPAPYLGRTPDSRVLALPGKGAKAVSGVILPTGSTMSDKAQKTYTVKLRARGSGALPADLAVGLFVGNPGGKGEVRELAAATREVGWDWVDIEFRVDGISSPAPALLMVAIERKDNNASTMLQVDDVRVVRTRLGVTAPTE